MGEENLARMRAAKGAILALLTGAYQKRDQVALVSFRGDGAEVLLAPTSSVLLARPRLRRLPLGGATPLAAGLLEASRLIRNARRRQPGLQPLLVLVSDGEANVPLRPGRPILPELFELARQLRRESIPSLVIDSHSEVGGSATLHTLAGCLGAGYRQLRPLQAGALLAALQEKPPSGRS